MERNKFKKYFVAQLESLIENFNSSKISISYSKSIASIKFSQEIVGKIDFKFLTGKQLPIGAIASIFISAEIYGGEIWGEIIKNELLKKKNTNPYTNFMYFFYSSSTKNYLFKNAKTDFFPSDDIEKKVTQFLTFVSEELLNKISNILLQEKKSIENILDTPQYYGQPEITILLLSKKYLKKDALSIIESDRRFSDSSEINKKIWETNKNVIFHE